MNWNAVEAEAAALHKTRGLPGLIVAVQRGDGPVEARAWGTDAAGSPLAPDTPLPVASITKLATALCALRCVAAGALHLDEPLACVLPDAAAAQEGVTLRRLLSHTAGLPTDLAPGAAPYVPSLSWETIQPPLLATPLATPPGTTVRYSNTGIGLVALAIERVAGVRFQTLLRQEVFAPLSIEATLGDEPPRPPGRILGDFGAHAGTPLEAYNTPWYRALGFPWGGMVTTAAGALALARAFFHGDLLPAPLRAEATRDQTHGLAGGFENWLQWDPCPWGLGAELHGVKQRHFVPSIASPHTAGHGGMSGAYAAWDPEADLGWALLGTRTMERWWGRMAAIGAAAYEKA